MGPSDFTLVDHIAGSVSWAFGSLVVLGVIRALSTAS
ncbi:hypothetical protein RHDE110596_19870 [Prescottella defluvii]